MECWKLWLCGSGVLDVSIESSIESWVCFGMGIEFLVQFGMRMECYGTWHSAQVTDEHDDRELHTYTCTHFKHM